jgi:hypothetical protein
MEGTIFQKIMNFFSMDKLGEKKFDTFIEQEKKKKQIERDDYEKYKFNELKKQQFELEEKKRNEKRAIQEAMAKIEKREKIEYANKYTCYELVKKLKYLTENKMKMNNNVSHVGEINQKFTLESQIVNKIQTNNYKDEFSQYRSYFSGEVPIYEYNTECPELQDFVKRIHELDGCSVSFVLGKTHKNTVNKITQHINHSENAIVYNLDDHFSCFIDYGWDTN